MSYLTVAPCVLVKNQSDGVDYHYAGQPIPWLSDEQRDQFLGDGLVVEVGDPGFAAVVEGAGNPGAVSKPVAKPAKTAADELWLDYGVAQGHNRDELAALGKAELREFLA